jgi:hypothetical protein
LKNKNGFLKNDADFSIKRFQGTTGGRLSKNSGVSSWETQLFLGGAGWPEAPLFD